MMDMLSKPIAMRDAFLEKICNAMKEDDKIFFLSADFGSPILDRIRKEHPDRFANVGVAEQNLINISAGLSIEGYTVFAYAIAPFITMRCYEQIRVNLALLSEVRSINVNLIGVGAGFSYVMSGPTHQCYEDLSIMRAMPNMSIYSPADHIAAVSLFDRCVEKKGPKYLRFDAQVLPTLYPSGDLDIKSGYNVLRTGKDICLIATGYMVHTALQVAKELSTLGHEVGVIDLMHITNFDRNAFEAYLRPYKGLVSMEEGFRGRGGLDSMLFELVAGRNFDKKLLNIGVEGGYRFELGTRAELHEKVGIGSQIVKQKILELSQQLN